MNTNKHLESFFGKLKAGLTHHYSLSECLSYLLDLERARDNELRFQVDSVWTLLNNNYYDPEMKTLLRFATHFVAKNVEGEYMLAKNKSGAYTYTVEDNQCFVEVQGRRGKRRLDVTT